MAAIVSTLALIGCERDGAAPTAESANPPDARHFEVPATELPAALREVSGLAFNDAGSLFAIADEVGRILEIDSETGAVLRQIDIGRPAIKGDFEGLGYNGREISAVTSDGKLYQINPQPAQGESASFTDLKTSKQCEIEGLSDTDKLGTMWLVCKRTLGDGDDASVRLLRWDPSQPTVTPEQFDIANGPILAAIGKKDFNPSAVALSADGQSLLVIAARQRSYARFSLAGDPRFIEAAPLPDAHLHRQAEGLAITKDGRLFIANEGAKTGRGLLFSYPNDTWRRQSANEDQH